MDHGGGVDHLDVVLVNEGLQVRRQRLVVEVENGELVRNRGEAFCCKRLQQSLQNWKQDS